jgi:translation initiation factor 1
MNSPTGKVVKMDDNSDLVYSTDGGRTGPSGRKSTARSQRPNKSRLPPHRPDDGIIRIGRDTKGRKGKGVTTISGLPGAAVELKEIAAGVKRSCGAGGSVKDGVIVIQGDHRLTLQAELTRQGYRVKLVG